MNKRKRLSTLTKMYLENLKIAI